jgi:hypothetical protein
LKREVFLEILRLVRLSFKNVKKGKGRNVNRNGLNRRRREIEIFKSEGWVQTVRFSSVLTTLEVTVFSLLPLDKNPVFPQGNTGFSLIPCSKFFILKRGLTSFLTRV